MAPLPAGLPQPIPEGPPLASVCPGGGSAYKPFSRPEPAMPMGIYETHEPAEAGQARWARVAALREAFAAAPEPDLAWESALKPMAACFTLPEALAVNALPGSRGSRRNVTGPEPGTPSSWPFLSC